MLSVVIPVLNAADVLEDQLRALELQSADEPWEVVIADNGSTDGSSQIARGWGTSSSKLDLKVVDASFRRGHAAARNAGVNAARGERLVFCDADDVVQPGWLKELAEALDRADIVVGSIELGSLNSGLAEEPLDPWPPHFRSFMRAGLAANMAVRRSAFDAVGGFAHMAHTGEDVDLCWRLQLAGYRLDFVQLAVVAKRNPRSLAAMARQNLNYGRGDVELYRRFRTAGLNRDVRTAVRAWGWLTLSIPRLRQPRVRRQWLEALFSRLGRLIGSFEQRTFYP